MSSNLKRTTISISAELYEAALQRCKTLIPPYKSFSEYVAYLIGKDCREKEKHIVVREESPDCPLEVPKKHYAALSIRRGACLLTVAFFLTGCGEARQSRSHGRDIELAQMDLQIKEAQLETNEAKARLDHELAKPVELQAQLGADGIEAEIASLQNAQADYNRKARHLRLLIDARDKLK